MLSLFACKMVVLVLAAASGLLGIYAARLGSNKANCRLVMSFANAFASGVLLAAGLVCMLPDATEELPKLAAYVCAGAAVIALIMVEEVAMFMATPSAAAPDGECYPMDVASDVKIASGEDYKPKAGVTKRAMEKVKSSGRYMTKKLRLSNDSKEQQVTDGDCYQLIDSEALLTEDNLGDLSCDGAMLISSQGLSTSKAICLFVALSFHSVMEGIGLGTAQKSSMLASIAVAILAHKSLAAFALGSALCKSDMSGKKIAVLACIFSAGTPTGIGIGTVVANSGNGAAASVCTAFAAGTFLQVSMMEIIPSVMQPAVNDTAVRRVFRCLLIGVGYAMMCVTIYFAG